MGCILCCFGGASSPPARRVSSERGESASGCFSGARGLFWCLGSSGSRGFRGCSFASDPCATPLLPRLPLLSHHCTLCEVLSWVGLQRPALFAIFLCFPVFGREALRVCRAHSRSGSGRDQSRHSLSRCQAVEGFVDVTCLAHCLLACGRSVIACGLRTVIDRVAFALARTT